MAGELGVCRKRQPAGSSGGAVEYLDRVVLMQGCAYDKITRSYTYTPGEGNGTPLQYSCLENPMDGGAW